MGAPKKEKGKGGRMEDGKRGRYLKQEAKTNGFQVIINDEIC